MSNNPLNLYHLNDKATGASAVIAATNEDEARALWRQVSDKAQGMLFSEWLHEAHGTMGSPRVLSAIVPMPTTKREGFE